MLCLRLQLVVGVVLMKKRSARRATGTGTKSAESGESTDSADPNAPAPVPVFEVCTSIHVRMRALGSFVPSRCALVCTTLCYFPYIHPLPPPHGLLLRAQAS